MRCVCCYVQPFQSGSIGLRRLDVEFFAVPFDENGKIQQSVGNFCPAYTDGEGDRPRALGAPPRQRVRVNPQ
jgi:hypothetical protein